MFCELNGRIERRLRGTETLEPFFEARSVSTRLETMPLYDCRKKSNTPLVKYERYNQHKQFNPGYRGPYNGYSNNVDVESSLFNRFAPLQKCGQVKFLPNSTSDLYNSIVPAADRMAQPFSLLQKQDEPIRFNPNECELAKETFHNHTRQDQKNINREYKKPASRIGHRCFQTGKQLLCLFC